MTMLRWLVLPAAASALASRWVVRNVPQGAFRADRDVVLREFTLDEVRDDDVLLEIEALSVDAFVRTTLDPTAFHGSRSVGSSVVANAVGKVVRAGEAASAAFPVGSRVTGILAAGTHAVTNTKANPTLAKVSNDLLDLPPSLHLGLFGISGATAYAGLFWVSKPPSQGDTVVVTAAAGAVGSLAAQMAKSAGARVVGVAGGAEKCEFLLATQSVDAAIDYKCDSKSFHERLDEACPDGVDFVFDNVGGDILDSLLSKINMRARVVICGAASQYDSGNLYEPGGVKGPSNYLKLAENSATMAGFVLGHYMTPENAQEFKEYALRNYASGELKAYQYFEDGIESFASGLEMLFNNGKQIGRLVIDVDGKQKKSVQQRRETKL